MAQLRHGHQSTFSFKAPFPSPAFSEIALGFVAVWGNFVASPKERTQGIPCSGALASKPVKCSSLQQQSKPQHGRESQACKQLSLNSSPARGYRKQLGEAAFNQVWRLGAASSS